MTDRPYTDDDLRAEAASQHKLLTEDPDFMGIGEQMQGTQIPSLTTDDDEISEGGTWDELPSADFDAAQRAIDDLLTNAADTSAWAVDLGADGLEPDPRAVTVDRDDRSHFTLHIAGHRLDDVRPLVRAHFAFAPDADRFAIFTRLGRLLGQSVEEPTPWAPDSPAAPQTDTETHTPPTGAQAGTQRLRADELTDDQLDALYERLDRAEGALRAIVDSEQANDGVTVRPTRYEASLLPESNINYPAYVVGIEYRGAGLWSVVRHGECLDTDGRWSWESRPSEREDEWIAAHRFNLDTALRLARQAAPHVRVGPRTAADIAPPLEGSER